MEISDIFENNRKWVEEKLKVDPGYFEDLSKGQSPEVLYIGCSDSRVTAEELMGARPGEVFVHRNIANMVSSTDLSAMSVVTYAVSYLKVRHVVVCGHYYCSGVKAAMQSEDMGLLNPWLMLARNADLSLSLSSAFSLAFISSSSASLRSLILTSIRA